MFTLVAHTPRSKTTSSGIYLQSVRLRRIDPSRQVRIDGFVFTPLAHFGYEMGQSFSRQNAAHADLGWSGGTMLPIILPTGYMVKLASGPGPIGRVPVPLARDPGPGSAGWAPLTRVPARVPGHGPTGPRIRLGPGIRLGPRIRLGRLLTYLLVLNRSIPY